MNNTDNVNKIIKWVTTKTNNITLSYNSEAKAYIIRLRIDKKRIFITILNYEFFVSLYDDEIYTMTVIGNILYLEECLAIVHTFIKYKIEDYI